MRMSRLVVAACLAVSFAIPACGGGDSDPEATGGFPGKGGSGSTSAAQGGSGSQSAQLTCDDAGNLDLSGIWAIYFRYSISLESQPGGAITMCPNDQVSSSTMYLLARVTQTGSAIEVHPVHCSMALPVVTGMVGDCDATADNLVTVQVLAPDLLIESTADVPMPPAAGTLSGTAHGASITMQDRFFYVMGTSASGNAMPQWLETNEGCSASDIKVGRGAQCATECVTDCSTVRDDDGDGLPAVTFHVCGTTKDDQLQKVQCNAEDPASAGASVQGKAMLVYQTDPRIHGKAASSCEASGTFDATTIYNVVGADVYLANTQVAVASAIKSLPRYVIDPQESQFRMIRVDGKYGSPDWGADLSEPRSACAIALQHQNELQ